MYKITFTSTSHNEIMTYSESVDFFGRVNFMNILKGLNSEVTAYPVEDHELTAVA